jgi:hypothetical protein
MAVMRLARLALRTAAWRTPRSGIAGGAPPATSRLQRQGPPSRVTYRRFATTQSRFAAAQREMDESLLDMDIDAAEKHMKDWFGDHASWSHDQLLKLVYGTATPRTTSHPMLTTARGGPYIPTTFASVWRLRFGRYAHWRWPSVFPTLDARGVGPY